MSLLTLALTLFLIINPLGNMKLFMSLMDGIKTERQRFVMVRELCIALFVMLFFSFLGERIAGFFHFTSATIFLSAGLILFLVAIKILFPSKEDHLPRVHGEEHFLVPIAIPVIASPALLASVMLFSQAEPLVWPMVVGIVIAWGLSALLFVNSKLVVRVLTANGVLAIERLMGMVLILIAVQRFMDGVLLFMADRG
jgi:multiple antibiotic resistance protein